MRDAGPDAQRRGAAGLLVPARPRPSTRERPIGPASGTGCPQPLNSAPANFYRVALAALRNLYDLPGHKPGLRIVAARQAKRRQRVIVGLDEALHVLRTQCKALRPTMDDHARSPQNRRAAPAASCRCRRFPAAAALCDYPVSSGILSLARRRRGTRSQRAPQVRGPPARGALPDRTRSMTKEPDNASVPIEAYTGAKVLRSGHVSRMSTPFEVLETPDVPANSSIVAPLWTVRRQMTARLFYGWWIVAVCLVAGLFGNALGLYGAGVYLRSIIGSKGWLPGAVSGAVTSFYLVSALLLVPVGSAISRCGPRPVMALGACAMAGGVAWIGHVAELWQAYAAFMMMGIGWACLSTTAVATTLAPWFEHYQGRAVSIASLGASAGGMAGAPVLLFGIGSIGFAATTTTAALVSFVILLPLFWFVLRRRPQDVGAFPDGAGVGGAAAFAGRPKWTRNDALRTAALRSVVVSFGIGMMVQVGFLTHQVTLLSTRLGPWGTSATVSMTAIAALVGRLALARFADRINQRTIAAIVLAMAAGARCAGAVANACRVYWREHIVWSNRRKRDDPFTDHRSKGVRVRLVRCDLRNRLLWNPARRSLRAKLLRRAS